jgi:glycosyltransferase involved in cell wall biosynthesis
MIGWIYIMKLVPSIDGGAAQDVATAPALVKVCIHVLKEARDDVRAMRTATALTEAGYTASIVDIEANSTLPVEENIHGVRVQHLIVPGWHTSRRFELWFFIKAVQVLFLSVLRLIKTRADIYHACEITAWPASIIAAILRRKSLVLETYDLQFPVPNTRVGFWRRLAWLVTLLHALILPRCAGVVVTSPLHAREIRNRFHPKEMALVRNIPMYREIAKSDYVRQFLGLSPETRIALFHGVISPDREPDRLIHAAKFLEQNIVIVMRGKCAGITQAELESLIDREGVTDRVKITPPVPFEEMLDWTASADIGLIIYPLDYSLNMRTLLPNKLFEYLMAGLPVLTTPLEAVVDVIRTYDVGHVVPSLDPAAIAEAINTMLADRATLDRMHLNALKAARDNLCWEKESPQLILFYQKILAKQNLRRSVKRVPPDPQLTKRAANDGLIADVETIREG